MLTSSWLMGMKGGHEGERSVSSSYARGPRAPREAGVGLGPVRVNSHPSRHWLQAELPPPGHPATQWFEDASISAPLL